MITINALLSYKQNLPVACLDVCSKVCVIFVECISPEWFQVFSRYFYDFLHSAEVLKLISHNMLSVTS